MGGVCFRRRVRQPAQGPDETRRVCRQPPVVGTGGEDACLELSADIGEALVRVVPDVVLERAAVRDTARSCLRVDLPMRAARAADNGPEIDRVEPFWQERIVALPRPFPLQ